MALLRSTIYAIVFYPATLLFVIACFIASMFGTDPMRAMVHRWTDFHHWFVRLLGIASRLRAPFRPAPT